MKVLIPFYNRTMGAAIILVIVVSAILIVQAVQLYFFHTSGLQGISSSALSAIQQGIVAQTLISITLVSVCLFGAAHALNRHITRTINSLCNTLVQIRKLNIIDEAHKNIDCTELAPLTVEINAIAHELDQLRRAHDQHKSIKVSEHTSLAGRELSNLSIIQSLTRDLRGLIEQTFSVAVMVTQGNDSPTTQVLTTNMVEGISMIDEVLLLLEKDELPTRRRFAVDTLSNHIHSVEHIIETLANDKPFPIRLALEKNITDANGFIVTDIHATIRFLSLCLEYWPKQLHTQYTPWHITIGMITPADRNPLLYYEFTSNHVDPSTIRSLETQFINDGINNSLEKKLNNIMKLYGMDRTITHPTPEQTVIKYTYDLIIEEKKADVARLFKAKYGVRKQILLVGNIEFLESVGQQFDALHIEHRKRFYHEIAEDSPGLDSLTGLIMVDCIGNPGQARRILNDFTNTQINQNVIRVSVVDKHALLPPLTNDTLIHEEYPADEFLNHPVLPTDIARLIHGLNAQHEVSSILDKLSRETS